MPYRRLPNTDAGRIRALKRGLEMLLESPDKSRFKKINGHLLHTELTDFEGLYRHYNDALRTQTANSKKLQQLSKNARIYVSHFIQVLNLAVIRKEVNKELKSLYGLNIDSSTVPDLISNEQILKWGERIIAGENARRVQGGAPLYNPSIARVNVVYTQFKEACFGQKVHQDSTNKWLERLRLRREVIDQLIHSLWNDIEEKFSSKEGQINIETCKAWGIVYYLRKNEREATKE
jgi:hypothetical protein